MNGSLVYSDIATDSTDGEISLNYHTSAIHILNTNSSTDAIVQLNGIYQILIPHTPNQATGSYVCIYGDYTKIQVITTAVTLSVFAIG
jgi:hypothetical protein